MRKAFKFWCIVNGVLCPVYFIVAACLVGHYISDGWGWGLGFGQFILTGPLEVALIGGLCDWLEGDDEGWLFEWFNKEPKKQLEKAPEVMELGRWKR